MPRGVREDVYFYETTPCAVMWQRVSGRVRRVDACFRLVSYMPLAHFLVGKNQVGHRERCLETDASTIKRIDMLVGRYLDRSDNFAAPDIKPCME